MKSIFEHAKIVNIFNLNYVYVIRSISSVILLIGYFLGYRDSVTNSIFNRAFFIISDLLPETKFVISGTLLTLSILENLKNK